MSEEHIMLTLEQIEKNWERYNDRPYPPIAVNIKDKLYRVRRKAHLITYGHTKYLEKEMMENQKKYNENYTVYIDRLIKWVIKTILKDNKQSNDIKNYDINILIELLGFNQLIIKEDIQNEIVLIYRYYRKDNIINNVIYHFIKDKYKILIKNSHYDVTNIVFFKYV